MGLNLERHVNSFVSRIIVNWDNVTRLHVCSEGDGKFRNFGNKGSILVEEAFFLYSLIRMTKPKFLVDAGTYIGLSAMFMQEAVRDNCLGRVVSIEHVPVAWETARRIFSILGYDEIDLKLTDIADFRPKEKIDFLFLDTETDNRVDQFMYLRQFFSDTCWVVFHDAGACKDINFIEHPFLHFKTVRELRVFYVA